MSRIDQALRRADVAAGLHRAQTPSGAERDASSGSTLDEYPLEPGTSPSAPAREAAVPRLAVPAPEQAAPSPPMVRKPVRPQPVRPQPALDLRERAVDGRLVVSAEALPIWVEQYRRLAATLYQAKTEAGLKTVMVSSALPREGKTLTVANLALTLSESYGQRVLVIDADLRNPSIHDVFGLSNETGLSDYLRDPNAQPAIVNVSAHLSVLPGGSADGNPIAGLVSDRMKHLMEAATSRFDWVLLDTPPVGMLPDANLLARLTDAVVFVIAASSSPYPVVQRALAAVGQERVIGIVLNRASESMLPSSTHYSNYAAGPTRSSAAGQHG